MADEQNKPTPAPTPFEPGSEPESIKETEQESIRELRDVPVEEVPSEQLSDVAQAVKEGEPEDVREARRAAEETLNKPIEAIEDTVNAVDVADHSLTAGQELPHRVGDSTLVLGYTIPLPLYTVIYITLAAITILEVLISSLPHSILTTIPLIGFSATKAILVVLFYMHLREDSRLFAAALIAAAVHRPRGGAVPAHRAAGQLLRRSRSTIA